MTTQTARVTGVDFVILPTRDFDAAVGFYGGVLGLPAGKRWGDRPAQEFQAGNLTLAVWDPTAFGQDFQPSRSPVALQAPDIHGTRAHLEAHGVTFRTETFDSGVCHQAVFEDPDGNLLILHHRYAPAGAERPRPT